MQDDQTRPAFQTAVNMTRAIPQMSLAGRFSASLAGRKRFCRVRVAELGNIGHSGRSLFASQALPVLESSPDNPREVRRARVNYRRALANVLTELTEGSSSPVFEFNSKHSSDYYPPITFSKTTPVRHSKQDRESKPPLSTQKGSNQVSRIGICSRAGPSRYFRPHRVVGQIRQGRPCLGRWRPCRR
jgi:hypothetical protein